MTILSDTANGSSRHLTFRLNSPGSAARLDTRLIGQGAITAASLDGRELDLTDYALASNGELRLGYSGVDSSGIEISVTIQSTETVSVAVIETNYGLPDIQGMPIQPRTSSFMPATGLPLDATVVRKTFVV